MSEIKNEKDAVCKALYLEFRKDNYTYQIVAVPPTVSEGVQGYPLKVRSRDQ